MDTLFLNCDLRENKQQDILFDIMNYFGRDFNLRKKVFSNELDFIVQQKEKDLLVLTTKLNFENISNSYDFNKLCVVNITPWADILDYNIEECFSLRNTADIRQKYGNVFYTNELHCNQNFILDRYDIFGFNRAAFIFGNVSNIDVESYKLAGFNFIGIVSS